MESFDVLLGAGADVNAPCYFGWTPAMLAARYGRLPVIESLAGAGAELNYRGYQGWTVLHLAIRYRHADVAKFLISEGAKEDVVDDHGVAPGETVEQRGCWGSLL